jgi:hypothetical protein
MIEGDYTISRTGRHSDVAGESEPSRDLRQKLEGKGGVLGLVLLTP